MSTQFGVTRRTLPSSVADGTNQIQRFLRYGESAVGVFGSNFQHICEEGQLLRGCTPTMGTAITISGATQTAWVATTPTITLRNSDAASGKRIVPISFKFTWVTAPTGATRVHCGVILDTITRYSSGGSALTIVNANSDIANTTIGVAHAGAITAVAASAPRNIGMAGLSTAIPVIGETYTIAFGHENGASHTTKGANFEPVVLGPSNHTLLIYLWFPGQTASGTCEVETSWMER